MVFGKYAQITNNTENDGCINAVLCECPPFIDAPLSNSLCLIQWFDRICVSGITMYCSFSFFLHRTTLLLFTIHGLAKISNLAPECGHPERTPWPPSSWILLRLSSSHFRLQTAHFYPYVSFTCPTTRPLNWPRKSTCTDACRKAASSARQAPQRPSKARIHPRASQRKGDKTSTRDDEERPGFQCGSG